MSDGHKATKTVLEGQFVGFRVTRPSDRLCLAIAVALALQGGWTPRALAEEVPPPLKEARALREEGQFTAALDVLRGESREIKQRYGEDSPRLLPINDLAADILIDQGSLEAAESVLEKTLDVRQRLVDKGQREQALGLGMALVKLSRLRTTSKRFPDALASAQRALKALDQAGGPWSPETVLAQESIDAVTDSLDAFLGPTNDATLGARDSAAATYTSLGMFAEAIGQRRRILDGLKTRYGDGGADVLQAAERLCRLMMVAGHAHEAVPILKEILATADPATPAAIAAMSLLAELQLADDQLIAADASCKAASEARRATERQPTCASTSDRMRRILIATRRQGSVSLPEWFEGEVRFLAKPPPAEAADAIAGLFTVSEILLASGTPGAAAGELTKALSLAGSVKPPSAQLVAEAAGHLARASLAADNPAAAFKTAEPAVAAAEQALGPGDARVAFLRIMLADAMWRANDTSKAHLLVDEALTRGLPRPDEHWEQVVVQTVDRLASAQPPKLAEGEENLPNLRDRFIAMRARQFGDQHRHVAAAWLLFAEARLAAGDWASATTCLSHAIAIQQASLGDEHPEVAASLSLLAHAERAAGEPIQAAGTATRALTIWEKVAGPDHPGTLTAIDVLVSARLQAGETSGVEELLQRLIAADSSLDPVSHARHLVWLADLVAPRDRDRARDHVETAMRLPCWTPHATVRAADLQQLACAAARASHAYDQFGDSSKREESLRAARSLALQVKESETLLDRVEELAAGKVSSQR